MSVELTILTGLVGLLALLAILHPAMLFEYPFAGAMLMWFFLLPQAWRIESVGELNDYEPSLTWGYMILCTLMTVIGFKAGNALTPVSGRNDLAALREKYDLDKLLHGAVALVVVGGGATILMNRASATIGVGAQWTGTLAFYQMISALLIYGASLGWLMYLYTGNKKALVLALIGLATTVPTILLSARRELSFTVVSVILLGIWFVRRKAISRIVLIPMLLLGANLVNQAGEIRSYIATTDSTLIDALSTNAFEEEVRNKNGYDEMASGVSDIAIALGSDDYKLFAPYYDTLIQLYIPAFIVGRDVKLGLKTLETPHDKGSYNRYYAGGATRTGFSDSFQAFHYLGSVIFLAISYYMGKLWKRATSGDIMSPFYYIILLSAGLKVFTESTSIFVGVLPLIFGSTYLVYRYALRPVKIANRKLLQHFPQNRVS